MATPRKPKHLHKKTGRPTKYDPALCDKLIAHMRRGHTFKSFGDVAGVHEETLWTWNRCHPEFRYAHKQGEMAAEGFYTQLLQSIAGGQLKRVVTESAQLGPDGRPVVGADGRVVMNRTYEPVRGNAACAIFLTKNICKWRDVQDQRHSGDAKNPVATTDLTERDQAELDRYRRRWQDCGDD